MWKILSLLLIVVPAIASADGLAGWDVLDVDLDDGSYDVTCTLHAHTTEQHVASAQLTLSTNLNPSTSSDQYGFKISMSGEGAQTNLAGALDQGHYIQFYVAAEEGYRLCLSNLVLKGESTSTGCDDMAILSDATGFNTNSVISSVSSVQDGTGGFDTDDSGFGGPIDLSGPEFSRLNAITFRIYGWNSTSGSGVSRIRNMSGYDLIVNGTTKLVPQSGPMLVVE